MTDTVNLGLPCIEGSQAQKHVTHNDALRILDALVQLAVLDRDLTAPPGAPAEGDRWIVKAGATGAWAGHDNAVAAWQDGAWQFSAPKLGWLAYVADEGTLVSWNGSAWGDISSTVSALQNLMQLGLGTTADAGNPFSAKLNNALFVAKSAAEGGDGNLRYKLSKESAANTLSFLFQDNYSGRAEVGLAGDDDFHFKVSPDGATWYDGIVISRTNGAVTFPNTAISGGRERLTANRTYYVRTDGSDVNNGLSNTAGGAFLTLQKAVNVALTLDLNGFDLTVQVGPGTYTAGVTLAKPFLGGNVTLLGDTATPSNVVISTTGAACIATNNKAVLAVGGFKFTTTTSGYALQASGDSLITVAGKVEFGAVAGGSNHIGAFSSVVNVAADYIISGSADAHACAADGGIINDYMRAITLTGAPAFSTAFAQAGRCAVILMFGNTFSGTATGPRYVVDNNAVVLSNGATLPGSSAGSVSNGGQYN